MFIDSHTHLDHCKEDASVLVDAADKAGVEIIIQSGIDLGRSRSSVALAERFSQVFATVGFHPQEAGLLDDEGRAGLEELARHSRVVAVGETGFDFYRDYWPHHVQEDVLLYHLDLARRASLPVVIHTRDAVHRTLQVLGEHAGGLTVILHCFSLPERLDEVVGRGYYISFAGNVTYRTRRLCRQRRGPFRRSRCSSRPMPPGLPLSLSADGRTARPLSRTFTSS